MIKCLIANCTIKQKLCGHDFGAWAPDGLQTSDADKFVEHVRLVLDTSIHFTSNSTSRILTSWSSGC